MKKNIKLVLGAGLAFIYLLTLFTLQVNSKEKPDNGTYRNTNGVWYMYIGDDKDEDNSQYATQITDPQYYQNTESPSNPGCFDSYQICAVFLPDTGLDHPDPDDLDEIRDEIESELEYPDLIVLKPVSQR